MKLNKNSSANIKYLRKKNKTCWSGLYDTSDTKSLRKVHEWSARKLRAMQARTVISTLDVRHDDRLPFPHHQMGFSRVTLNTYAHNRAR